MNILLIDDELEFCQQARDYLEKFGHQVTIETTGTNAYAVFENTSPSIVVIDVDLGLSSLDGRTICAEIAKSDPYIEGKTGIIMISGHYIAPNDEVLRSPHEKCGFKVFKLICLSLSSMYCYFLLNQRARRVQSLICYSRSGVRVISKKVLLPNACPCCGESLVRMTLIVM